MSARRPGRRSAGLASAGGLAVRKGTRSARGTPAASPHAAGPSRGASCVPHCAPGLECGFRAPRGPSVDKITARRERCRAPRRHRPPGRALGRALPGVGSRGHFVRPGRALGPRLLGLHPPAHPCRAGRALGAATLPLAVAAWGLAAGVPLALRVPVPSGRRGAAGSLAGPLPRSAARAPVLLAVDASACAAPCPRGPGAVPHRPRNAPLFGVSPVFWYSTAKGAPEHFAKEAEHERWRSTKAVR